MAEYIEREKLFEAVKDKAITQFDWSEKVDLEEFEEVLLNIPSADVVEVVRCKDCRYYEPKNSIGSQGICNCGEMEMNYGGEFYPLHTDFCSYGEKKECEG